jgi:hypothetical protein
MVHGDQLIGPCVQGFGRQLRMKSGVHFHIDDLVFLSGDLSRCYMVKACFQNEAFGLLLLGVPQGVVSIRAQLRNYFLSHGF